MGAFLSWDRDDHFAADHGISGISRKTVQYCGGMLDIGFASYPVGELLCQFLNYDPTTFFALKRQRDGRVPVSPEQLAAVLSGMPYYRDLMSQLEPDRQPDCAQLFSQYQRGVLWQGTWECFKAIENKYFNLACQIAEAAENDQNALRSFVALPAEVLNSPALGASSHMPISRPAPSFVIRGSKEALRLAEQYRLTRLTELVYMDLMHLLLAGSSIHRCRHCGRFFVPERDYNYRYCSRVAPGETERTCREVGAARARQSKLENSAVLTAYQRAYKRYYARVLKQRWSKEQFQRWQEAAVCIRSEAEAAHWPAQQLEDRLREAADTIPVE